jgi:ubiquinone/menaquinone biosynthesis C-methylase UbiE
LAELHRVLVQGASILPGDDEESIPLELAGDLRRVLQLRTVVAVYLVGFFPIPRPLALLGHQSFQRLLGLVRTALDLHRPGDFATFRISAAGEDSPAFARIREELAGYTGLGFEPKNADLLLRVRRAVLHPDGWEVLVRLSPRPLSVRPWRVHNMPGALNATVAAAMVEMTRPRPGDRFLNLLCGSGTLLAERLLRCPARVAVGCDVDPAALAGARANLEAAGLAGAAQLLEMDATRLRFPAGSFDVICGDLPWGQLVGSRRTNPELYAGILAEAHRVACPGGRLLLLTHEIDLMESILPSFTDCWTLEDVVRVFQGGLHPRVYVLRRR